MTARFVLLGHPVGHSVSPAMHTAAYRELGLNAEYLSIDCPDPEAVRREVERLRGGELSGANVTVPHKKLALSLADRGDPLAKAVGAANVLRRMPDGNVEAHNTDVAALADELGLHQPSPRAACVLGSGGAALAAVVACQRLGASVVHVAARAFSDRVSSAALVAEFRALGATPRAMPSAATEAAWCKLFSECQMVVQATSAGMHGADSGEALASLIPWTVLQPGALAYDLVYNPPVTPFLKRARENNVTAVGGLGMLVGQAEHSVMLWTGMTPDRSVMRQAAENLLFKGGISP